MSPRPPGLSVCCLTDNNPLMVAEALRPFRGVADEIVIAVDSWVDPSTLGPLAEIADTLVRFDFVHPPERARPWLVQLCSYQTVLMIDGDEVPSTALLAQLPTLVADPEPVQFRLGRRWCFPDERSWLGERPWWPDYQLRMVRQGPLLDFDLRVHGGVRPALPARYVDEPLYHLVHPLIPFAQRRARVRVYAADRPGLVAVGGGPMNDTLYVPEHFATLRPRPTPPDDLVLLRRVLEAARLEPDAGGPAVERPGGHDGRDRRAHSRRRHGGTGLRGQRAGGRTRLPDRARQRHPDRRRGDEHRDPGHPPVGQPPACRFA